MSESTTFPTRARFKLLAFLASLVFILYLDRVCMGIAAGDIMRELGISRTQMGFVHNAFIVAYAMFEVPTGRWGDRYGSRGVLTRIVLWWSAFTALTGCVFYFSVDSGRVLEIPWLSIAMPIAFDSFLLLMLVRFLFGAGEAGALPNNARVVAQWFPLEERGLVQGVILTCMQLGGASSPIFAGYLIQWLGWRWAFYVFGAVGVVWAAVFYRWFRDDPAEHPAVGPEELSLIRTAGTRPAGADDHPPVPWRSVLSSANVWLLGGIMTCSASASYMYMSWFPTYLEQGRGVKLEDAKWLASLVLAGGAAGSFLGGWLSGRIEHWTGEPRWGRRLMGFSVVAIAGLLLGASVWCETPWGASLCAALASACAHSQIANWWSVVMAISGRHLGVLFGLMNSMGVPGAFASQLFMGVFSEWRERQGFSGRLQWDPAFYVYTIVLLIGACCWLFIDPTRSAVEEESSPHAPA